MTSKQILPDKTKILACRVLEPELRALGLEESDMYFLDQGLHRYPTDLNTSLKQALDHLEQGSNIHNVVLGYGLCGGGLEGLASQRVTLHVPLIHDCIPLLRGKRQDVTSGGSFYLSPGWIDHGRTPLTEFEITAEMYDQDEAMWVGREMLKGYKEVVLIQNQARITNEHCSYARRMAQLFGLTYREEQGRSAWLHGLLACQGQEGILTVPPGRTIRQKDFPTAVPTSGQKTHCG
ncbi:MAG: DUF1638 domain-containing protein [Thermodesulfobacteriota bacterium]